MDKANSSQLNFLEQYKVDFAELKRNYAKGVSRDDAFQVKLDYEAIKHCLFMLMCGSNDQAFRARINKYYSDEMEPFYERYLLKFDRREAVMQRLYSGAAIIYVLTLIAFVLYN